MKRRAPAAPPPVVLTIAGSDSGAGAGIQADSRAIHALGGFACTAITALTAQNTLGVTAWRPTPPALLAAQIDAVLSDLPVAALKTGLLPGAPAIRAVATALARHPRRLPLVIDPVIGSTSGTRFLDAAGLRALRRHLFPLATLITPNWPEAAALTGLPVTTLAEAEQAARALARSADCAVLLKGGHSPDRARCVDLLVLPSPAGRPAPLRLRRFSAPRLATPNTHGTGCTLSAAIAAGLARGLALPAAVSRARALLRRGLFSHRSTRLGSGRGPAFFGLRSYRK